MRFFFRTTTLLVAVLGVHGEQQFLYPDEFEIRQLESLRQKQQGNKQNPVFEPALQIINDVESGPLGSSPVAVQPQQFPQQSPQPIYQFRTPLSSAQGYRTSLERPETPFDSFLPPRWRNHVINIISRGISKFTLDMDRAIDMSSPKNYDNLIFSPISLTVTLAMVLLASGGKTFEEVVKILGLESGVDISNHSEVVHQIFGLIIQESNRNQLLNPSLPQCKFGFGIFVEDGYPVREQFRSVSEKVYMGEVLNVDFSHNSEEAKSIINDWVRNKTNGRIKNMLDQPPSPLTNVIITSALYFSGEWDQHFIEGQTKRKPFNVGPNEVVYVDMMYSGGEFAFHEDKELGLKIIGFPYKGHDVTMYVILPNVPGLTSLTEIKRRLTPEIIDNLISSMDNKPCIIGFPKMKLSTTLQLQSALEALGLHSLFNPQTADLSVLSPGLNISEDQNSKNQTAQVSNNLAHLPRAYSNFHRYDDKSRGYTVEQWDTGYNLRKLPEGRGRAKRQTRPIDQEFIDFINSQKFPTFGVDQLRNSAGISNPGLYAEDVIHKVEMTVNEKGTEAAASTSVLLNRSGDFKRFIANSPFLFFIRQNSDRSIWFWGTIKRPTPFFTSI